MNIKLKKILTFISLILLQNLLFSQTLLKIKGDNYFGFSILNSGFYFYTYSNPISNDIYVDEVNNDTLLIKLDQLGGYKRGFYKKNWQSKFNPKIKYDLNSFYYRSEIKKGSFYNEFYYYNNDTFSTNHNPNFNKYKYQQYFSTFGLDSNFDLRYKNSDFGYVGDSKKAPPINNIISNKGDTIIQVYAERGLHYKGIKIYDDSFYSKIFLYKRKNGSFKVISPFKPVKEVIDFQSLSLDNSSTIIGSMIYNQSIKLKNGDSIEYTPFIFGGFNVLNFDVAVFKMDTTGTIIKKVRFSTRGDENGFYMMDKIGSNTLIDLSSNSNLIYPDTNVFGLYSNVRSYRLMDNDLNFSKLFYLHSANSFFTSYKKLNEDIGIISGFFDENSPKIDTIRLSNGVTISPNLKGTKGFITFINNKDLSYISKIEFTSKGTGLFVNPSPYSKDSFLLNLDYKKNIVSSVVNFTEKDNFKRKLIYKVSIKEALVSIDNPLKDPYLNDLGIYPNPSNGNFQFSKDLQAGSKVSVFAMDGKQIYPTIISLQGFDLSNQFKGIYIVKVESISGFQHFKVVVE